MPISYAGPRPIPGRELTFFAFDDYSLAFQQNLALYLLPARKHPDNPILCGRPGGPDAHGVQHGTIIRQEGRFRYWYSAIPAVQTTPADGPRIAYAESADGIHWERPNLGLAEWRGSTDNNLVLLEPSDSPFIRPSYWPGVLYDPEEPDERRRYKMTFITWVTPEQLRDVGLSKPLDATMMTAESPDGLRWQLTSDALPLRDKFEVTALYRFDGWYYAGGQQVGPWVCLPEGRQTGRVASVFRSRDFRHWSPERAIAFQRPAQQSAPPGTGEEAHCGLAVWNRGSVLVGFYGQWHGAAYQYGPEITVDVGLTVSNDGVHFREPEVDFKVIPRGNWDKGFIFQFSSFQQVRDETWVWYSATLDRGNSLLPPRQVGLAMWRRDGFGYLALKDRWEDGSLLTCPIGLGDWPARVFLNVENVGEGAWARVEVLDERDEPLPGYGAEEAAPITEAGLRQPAVWTGRETIVPPAGGRVTLRVTLHAAGRRLPRLYALYVEDAEP